MVQDTTQSAVPYNVCVAYSRGRGHLFVISFSMFFPLDAASPKAFNHQCDSLGVPVVNEVNLSYHNGCAWSLMWFLQHSNLD